MCQKRLSFGKHLHDEWGQPPLTMTECLQVHHGLFVVDVVGVRWESIDCTLPHSLPTQISH